MTYYDPYQPQPQPQPYPAPQPPPQPPPPQPYGPAAPTYDPYGAYQGHDPNSGYWDTASYGQQPTTVWSSPPPPPRTRRGVLIAALAIIAVGAVGGGVLAVVLGNKRPDPVDSVDAFFDAVEDGDCGAAFDLVSESERDDTDEDVFDENFCGDFSVRTDFEDDAGVNTLTLLNENGDNAEVGIGGEAGDGTEIDFDIELVFEDENWRIDEAEDLMLAVSDPANALRSHFAAIGDDNCDKAFETLSEALRNGFDGLDDFEPVCEDFADRGTAFVGFELSERDDRQAQGSVTLEDEAGEFERSAELIFQSGAWRLDVLRDDS